LKPERDEALESTYDQRYDAGASSCTRKESSKSWK
jgi:hypothetical protein